jgi:serine/threonine-protein kinase
LRDGTAAFDNLESIDLLTTSRSILDGVDEAMMLNTEGDTSRLAHSAPRRQELRAEDSSASADASWCTDAESADEPARRVSRLDDTLLATDESASASGGAPLDAASARCRRRSATARADFHDLRFHASGALGEVFTARNAELNREVALKFLKPERSGDPDSRRRFLLEAEVTGRLEHPGVVPIYALGTDAAGSPCYAMRFVRGETLQDAIAAFHAAEKAGRDPSERSLALRELLGRFVSICGTIGYAHSRGILHRDLKPRNVMLGRFDETLVVDWGLAKPFERDESDGWMDEEALTPTSGSEEVGSGTPTVGAVGTLGYMSPEQAEARWEEVGPASDIFGLGAILYALLTGRTPYQARTIEDILEKVKRCEFRRPRQIKPGVPRALEAICLKAMARRPEERYATALDLAADVRRWLADEAVMAYAEPRAARARRWMRRHRALFSGAVAALAFGLAVLAGFATLLAGKNRELDAKNAELAGKNRELERQRQRAERHEALAIDAVRKFRDAVQSNADLKNRSELGALRKVLLEEPQGFFRKLKDDLQSDRDARPDALARLARASHDLAKTTEEIGSITDAIRSYSESIEILERLVRDRPDTVAYQEDLSASRQRLGHLLSETARPVEALESYHRALGIRERLAREHPDVAEYQGRLAGTHSSIGTLLHHTGRPVEAMESHRRALEVRGRLAREHPGVADCQTALAGTHNNIGLLLREMGRPSEAVEAERRALEVRERLAREHPDVAEYQTDLAGSHHNLGLLLNDLGRTAEALESFRRGLAIRERLARDLPSVTEYQSDLAHSLNGTGFMLDVTGRKGEALESHRRALAIRERLVAANPAVTEHRSDLARSLNNIGSLLHESGRSSAALATYRRAQAALEQLVRENPAVPAYRSALGSTLNDMAAIEIKRHRWHPARECLVRAFECHRQALAAMPDHPRYLAGLRRVLAKMIRVYAALDQPSEAIRSARECASLARRDPEELYNVACHLSLCVALAREGSRRILADEAVESLKWAIAAGWADAALTGRDRDLDPLRDRDDFRQLLAEMFDRRFPADPFAR